MSRFFGTRRDRLRHPFGKGLGVAAVLFLVFMLLVTLVGSFDLPRLGGNVAHASQADAQVATSVCDAHRLRALNENDPAYEIEIPAEFDKKFPTASACESYDRAQDVEAPGPMQPIAFSHKAHSGQFKMDCQYCHSGTDQSRTAGMPSVEVCMGCHGQFPREYDELKGIQDLKRHWEDKTPIVWQQIHRLPEYVKFRHNRHVAAGVTCQKCHGPVEEIDKLYLVPDTKWWQYGLPTAKLEMGWCVMCHRENNQQASQDCLTCHY